MASEVLMPKQGNTVEECIILEWKVKEGDKINVGDIVCEAETDKSTIEVESTVEGTILKLWYQEGDEVPVMYPIMSVGEPGEVVSAPTQLAEDEAVEVKAEVAVAKEVEVVSTPVVSAKSAQGASPRAKNLASEKRIALHNVAPRGPKGRIIARDVTAAAKGKAPLSPLAKETLSAGGLTAPVWGSGIGGRVLAGDLLAATAAADFQEEVISTPVKGIRKVTANRMHQSLATTAQFSISTYADATALQQLRARFKGSREELGLNRVTINDIVLYAVTKTIEEFPFMNAHFYGDEIRTFKEVHLGCAVDTPKGLLVPVIKFANRRSLKGISDEFKRLAGESVDGKAKPDDLEGGTFTVTNLGALGVDTFTPVLNAPEIAILGVGGISMRAVEDSDGDLTFVPHLALSLTIDHQAVDGAPASRFLKALANNIANVDILLAL